MRLRSRPAAAHTFTMTSPASIAAFAAARRCSRRTPSSIRAAAGRATSSRSIPPTYASSATPRWEWSAPRSSATSATRTWVMSFPTGRRRPGFVIASIRRRSRSSRASRRRAHADVASVRAMAEPVTFKLMLRRLLRGEGQGRAARTVEIYGWLVLVEGVTCMIAPRFVTMLLHMPPLVDQGVNYFRLAGVWVAGIGLLYLLSGRLNATGFVFATLLDRPIVLPLLGVLWYLGMVPGTFALAAGLQDLLTGLWTLTIWRQEFGGTVERRRPSA